MKGKKESEINSILAPFLLYLIGITHMSIAAIALTLIDNGGKRSGIDRRQFSYSYHIPEKRSSKDRRNGIDRRSGLDQRSGIARRIAKVIEMKLGKDQRERKDRRTGLERRAAFATALAY